MRNETKKRGEDPLACISSAAPEKQNKKKMRWKDGQNPALVKLDQASV